MKDESNVSLGPSDVQPAATSPVGGLSLAHYERHIVASGIADHVARKRGYVTVASTTDFDQYCALPKKGPSGYFAPLWTEDQRRLIGAALNAGNTAVWIPTRGIQGVLVSGTLRFDRPVIDATGDEKRYLRPAGTPPAR